MPIWTLTYNGVEKSCSDWGLTAKPVIKTRDRSETVFSFRLAGAAPEAGVPFPFRAQVIIRQNPIPDAPDTIDQFTRQPV